MFICRVGVDGCTFVFRLCGFDFLGSARHFDVSRHNSLVWYGSVLDERKLG